MTSGTAYNCLVDIFYHIRQVAARVAKLVMGCISAFWTPNWGREGCSGQRWCHSKEHWWFPIGSPLRYHSATFVIECLRRSNQQGARQFAARFGEAGLTDVSKF